MNNLTKKEYGLLKLLSSRPGKVFSRDEIFESVWGDDVYVIKGAPIPQGGSLEVMSGNKIVLQTSDALQCLASASNALDVVLSIMEIT